MSFQSLYVGTTGLVSHGMRMQTIGNNIANVNTLGFKSANMHFETLISQNVTAGNASGTGMAQRGLGVDVGGILTDFRTASPMTGSASTDLAISGKGFFRVVKPDGNENVYYTRAGNFRFDNNGYLVDPNGCRLQGKTMNDGVAGSTGDIQLDQATSGMFTIAPTATTSIRFVPNLGNSDDNTASASDPFFSMLSSWDATKDVPLDDARANFNHTMTIYDEYGEPQSISFHFDKVTLSNADGNSYYEFMVTMDPSKDGSALAGTSGAGVLTAGVMAFGSTGELKDISTFQYDGEGDIKQLSNWAPQTTLGAGGYPQITATFAASGSNAATTSTISLNFGIHGDGVNVGGASNAKVLGGTSDKLGGLVNPTREATVATNYTGSSVSTFQSQDGTGRGYLQNVAFTRGGMMVGNYSNGVQKELFQLTLYNFPGEFGLRREGGNHFSETLESGAAVEGTPDTENYGLVNGNSLETSNVDMAEQFTKMIVTERGFQANSKVITTTDKILQILTGMKR